MNELTAIDNSLSLQEADRFDDLEICIANGLQTFVEVGEALAEIRDGRLYRQHYATFEDYCQRRWGFTRMRASQFISASQAVSNVNNCLQTPQTESQARPLTRFNDDPELQQEIWETAVSTAPNGKVTAKHVEETIKEVMSQTPGVMSTGGSNGVDINSQNGRDLLYKDGEIAWCKYCYQNHDNWTLSTDHNPPAWICLNCDHATFDNSMSNEMAEKKTPHVTHNSGNNEWYTPEEIIEAARSVMGEINLDPASSDLANTIIKANDFLTVEDDGLSREWYGNVWLNPPYSSDLIGKFCEKIHKEYMSNRVSSACILVNNATETQWFRLLVSIADGICFPASRIKFWKPNGEIGQPLQGQAILYIGVDLDSFVREFSPIGFIVEVLNG